MIQENFITHDHSFIFCVEFMMIYTFFTSACPDGRRYYAKIVPGIPSFIPLAIKTPSNSTSQQPRYSKIQWTITTHLLLPQKLSTMSTKIQNLPHLQTNLPLRKIPSAVSCWRRSKPMSNYHFLHLDTSQNHSSSTALSWIHSDYKKFFSFQNHQSSNPPECNHTKSCW